MAIAYDNALGFQQYPTASSTYNTSFTVGSDDNRLLLVWVSQINAQSSDPSSITYNGISLTKYGHYSAVGTSDQASLWYLYAPASGSNTLAFTFSTSTAFAFTIVSYSGVSQTGFPDNIGTVQSQTSSSSVSATITPIATGAWGLMGVEAGRAISNGTNFNVRGSVSANNQFGDSNAIISGSTTMTANQSSASSIWALPFTIAPAGTTTTQTTAGFARIQKSVTQTTSGTARITTIVPKTQSGISRITAATKKTTTGVSRITASTVQTTSGVASLAIKRDTDSAPMSSGPNNPSTGANDASAGSVAWSDPTNVETSDGSYATVTLSSQTSEYLKATGFGFDIPAGATITGIKVEIEKAATGTISDNAVRIVKSDGSIGTTDKSDATAWPSTEAYTTYGSSIDLWGETWTPDDINSSDFGVVIQATD